MNARNAIWPTTPNSAWRWPNGWLLARSANCRTAMRTACRRWAAGPLASASGVRLHRFTVRPKRCGIWPPSNAPAASRKSPPSGASKLRSMAITPSSVHPGSNVRASRRKNSGRPQQAWPRPTDSSNCRSARRCGVRPPRNARATPPSWRAITPRRWHASAARRGWRQPCRRKRWPPNRSRRSWLRNREPAPTPIPPVPMRRQNWRSCRPVPSRQRPARPWACWPTSVPWHAPRLRPSWRQRPRRWTSAPATHATRASSCAKRVRS